VSICWTSATWLVPAAGCRSRNRSSVWWFEPVSPNPTSARWRKTLLAAKSIAYSDSSSGTYLATIGFKKLGVADEISGKTRKVRGPPSGELVAAVVARGEAEVGFQQVPELIHVPGVDFVGTVPPEVQPPTVFVGALPKNSQHPDIAIGLLHFLSSAEAAAVTTKAGLKPIAAR
jgi:molybdate transport system substrate-binding protein